MSESNPTRFTLEWIKLERNSNGTLHSACSKVVSTPYHGGTPQLSACFMPPWHNVAIFAHFLQLIKVLMLHPLKYAPRMHKIMRHYRYLTTSIDIQPVGRFILASLELSLHGARLHAGALHHADGSLVISPSLRGRVTPATASSYLTMTGVPCARSDTRVDNCFCSLLSASAARVPGCPSSFCFSFSLRRSLACRTRCCRVVCTVVC